MATDGAEKRGGKRLDRREGTPDPDEKLSAITKDAMRAYSRSMQIRLVDHSVSIGHWLFLRALWTSPGLTQRELSQKVGVMEPTTFSALRALEKLGYVTREKKAGNRKKVHIYLTPEGEQLESVLMPLADELNRIAVAGISQEDIQTTKRTLIRIIGNLLKDEEELLQKERRVPSTRDLSQLVWGQVMPAKEKKMRPMSETKAGRLPSGVS